MLASVTGCTVVGIEGQIVDVEVYLSAQLPSFDIVGLPDTAVKEARDRVKAALKNSQFQFPQERVVINLAPADLKKEGPQLDLAMALGILRASGQIQSAALPVAFLGELALDGSLRSVRGVLPMVLAARQAGVTAVLLPRNNAREAALVSGMKVWGVENVREAVAVLSGESEPPPPPPGKENYSSNGADFSRIKGQAGAKRALEIAAAGGHSVLMTGPPGSGKTMLARSIPSILPLLTEEESLETTKIYSAAGLLNGSASLITQRPYRAPHHTVSPAALCGGGRYPRPGEISLAHNGVLFLDEIPELRREALEVLRQPLEEGKVTVARLQATYSFPARFMLIASMNPCPCGMLSDPGAQCVCSDWQIRHYRHKLSGPFLDRMDLFVEVSRLQYEEVSGREEAESSAQIASRIHAARQLQSGRFCGHDFSCNAQMGPCWIQKYCEMDDAGNKLLQVAFSRMHLSARAYHRILKVARTIADLAGDNKIRSPHVAEAISYRQNDTYAGGL